jgi:chromosome segregation ATPase
MKRKIVLWGTNEKDEKILVALHLQDKEGIVKLYTFNEQLATEEFYNKMLNQWRENKEVEFPDGHTTQDRPLNISDSILPEEVKVERTDIISRAQTEWHFVVLSAKLYEMYRSELEDLTETVENLKEYDNKVWNEMRNFWSKVQEQVIEKNLFRDHASTLKSNTNRLFDRLKDLKKEVEAKYESNSAKYKETVMTELADIEARVEKGLGLKPIFEELKTLQSKLRGMKFTKKDRDLIWNKIDAAFKVVKEKRFGDKGKDNNGNTAIGRHQRRYDGLINAIQKMEKSIARDKDDQKFQNRKIETTDGQLEMQIRQAKIKMIDERVKSKEVKLADMYKTRKELEEKIAKEKAKAEKQAKMNAAKAEAEAKIAAEVK